MIGDPHIPPCHPMYLRFCRDIAESHQCTRIVIIDDIVDHHNISFHRREVDSVDVNSEFDQVLEQIADWHETFPKATVTIGNHDERIYRLAASVGIPGRAVKSYNELWQTHGWNWVSDITIDDVHYFHGTGHSGERPAFLAARASMVSTVLGHVHSVAGVNWMAGPNGRLFGMDVGCGVDIEHVSMRYGRHMSRKPILACGVVRDGQPLHYAMPCGPKERYNRRRA